MAQSYALDSERIVLSLVFKFAFQRLTLSASSCGGETYDREEKPPSIFGIASATISAALACSPFIGRGMPLSIPRTPCRIDKDRSGQRTTTDVASCVSIRSSSSEFLSGKMYGQCPSAQCGSDLAYCLPCFLKSPRPVPSLKHPSHNGSLCCFYCRSEGVLTFR